MAELKSSYIEVMGDNPKNRIIDFLVTERGLFDYSKTEIAKEADVAWGTTDKIIDDLVKDGIVKKTREVGRAEMYMLNEKNPIAQMLVASYLLITKSMLQYEAEGGCLSIQLSVTQKRITVDMKKGETPECVINQQTGSFTKA